MLRWDKPKTGLNDASRLLECFQNHLWRHDVRQDSRFRIDTLGKTTVTGLVF